MKTSMSTVLVALVALLALPALAQTGDFLRAVNDYGPTYYPTTPEELRLPEPGDGSMPDFVANKYEEILAASVTTGRYYDLLIETYDASIINESDPKEFIKNVSRQKCGVEGVPGTKKDLDCLNFYAELGTRAYELAAVPRYGLCRGNTFDRLDGLNAARKRCEVTDIEAVRDYAVLATALKWCQVTFNETLTVVPPTAQNTIPANAPPVTNCTTKVDITTNPVKDDASFPQWLVYVGVAMVVLAIALFVVLGRGTGNEPKTK